MMIHWSKIFSGKFIFTVMTSFVFAYAVYSRILNSEQTHGIIMLVVAAYFSRSRDEAASSEGARPS